MNGEFTDSQLEILENTVFTEAVSLSRIKAMSVYLKNIHNDTPNEYSDADEVKKFIDKNYSELSRTLKEMEDSKGKASKEEIKSWVATAILLIGFLLTADTVPAVGFILYVLGFTSMVVAIIATSIRLTHEKDMIRTVLKLKISVKKLLNHENIDDRYKNRISEIVKKLEDIELDYRENNEDESRNIERQKASAQVRMSYALMNR